MTHPPTMPKANTSKRLQPGRLFSQGQLRLQTRAAQRLFYGIPRGSHSLLQFARYLHVLWKAARSNDPYADWQLLKIYDALTAAKNELAEQRAHCHSLLQDMNGLVLQPASTEQPVEVPLTFATPYAFIGARVLADFDEWVRLLLTCQYLGIQLAPHAEQQLHQWKKRLRRLWALPQRWPPTGITRHDVLNDTETYQRLQAQRGKLPPAIIDGSIRAPHAPRIQSVPQSARDHNPLSTETTQPQEGTAGTSAQITQGNPAQTDALTEST